MSETDYLDQFYSIEKPKGLCIIISQKNFTIRDGLNVYIHFLYPSLFFAILHLIINFRFSKNVKDLLQITEPFPTPSKTR